MHGNHLHPLLSQPAGRRGALLGILALAVAGTADILQPAMAARGWCRTDPLVELDDELVYIICSAPKSIRQKATGPTEIVVTVPFGVQTRLVAAGPNFGMGETIQFEYSHEIAESKPGIDIRIEARVPASEDLPIGLEFDGRTHGKRVPAKADGRTNTWVTLSTRFAPQQLAKKRRDQESPRPHSN